MNTRTEAKNLESRDQNDGRGQKTNKDHSKKVTIIVNTREHLVDKNQEISFEEVVSLAHDSQPPTGPYIEFSVMYRRGHGNRDGSLIAGQTVKVKERMVFNVTTTDRS